MTAPKKRQIPGYKLLTPLGSGGQASVYKAIQLSMRRPVAIKLILPERGVAEIELHRFMREAQVLAKLNHENIVHAIDYGEVDGIRYLVMTFVEGVSVQELIEDEGALGIGRSLQIAIQACKALGHAASLGVIHRDVKPANLVITKENKAVLVDFGLARPESSDLQLTMAGSTVGTPHYMSPEQIRGDDQLDPRADLYAVGATLFHMVTGRVPFPSQSRVEIMASHLRQEVILPEDLPYEVPGYVFDVITRAMAKDRDERYQSAEEMLSELRMAKQIRSSGEGGITGTDLLGRGRERALMKQVDDLTRERDHLKEYAASLQKRLEALEAKVDLSSLDQRLVAPRSEPELAVDRLPGSSLASPMAYVAAGPFLYGEDEGDFVVKPRRTVQVETFWIDVYPVTNLGYLEFVKATHRLPPGHWGGREPQREILDHPVVGVTYQDAVEYATWCGKRLPTPVEWQKAARGVDGRRFPWGNEANVSRLNCRGTGIDTTSAVGRFPGGVSPCGLHDMAGNVAEWVSGRFGEDKEGRVLRAVCGGSFRDSIMRSQCAARRGYRDGGKAPYVGFRCARDPEPEAKG